MGARAIVPEAWDWAREAFSLEGFAAGFRALAAPIWAQFEPIYDILTNENRKDFPPEWNAAKLHAQA